MRDLTTMQTPDIPQSLSTGISSVVNEHSQMSSDAERHISARERENSTFIYRYKQTDVLRRGARRP